MLNLKHFLLATSISTLGLLLPAQSIADTKTHTVAIGDINENTPVLSIFNEKYTATTASTLKAQINANQKSTASEKKLINQRHIILVNTENLDEHSLVNNDTLSTASDSGMPIIFTGIKNNDIAKIIASKFGIGVIGDNVLVLPPVNGFGGKQISYFQEGLQSETANSLFAAEALSAADTLSTSDTPVMAKKYKTKQIVSMIESWIDQYYDHKQSLQPDNQ